MEVSMPTNPSRRNALFVFSLVLGLALALMPTVALAQQEEYRLNISRTFGFSSGSGQVRGNFSASITGQLDNVQEVTYLIDGESMGVVSAPPFKLPFVTSNFPVGWHDLSAQVLTKDGRNVETGVRQFEFVSADQESAFFRNTVLPLLGVLFLVIILGIGIQVLFTRNKSKVNLPLGAARKYGISGGTICPKCHRPFAIHWWAFNAGITSKFDRCDFCGRYGLFRRYNRDKLAAAEAAELQMAQPEKPIQAASEEQKLKEMLDESRYTDKS
jgi:hypothetical protein